MFQARRDTPNIEVSRNSQPYPVPLFSVYIRRTEVHMLSESAEGLASAGQSIYEFFEPEGGDTWTLENFRVPYYDFLYKS